MRRPGGSVRMEPGRIPENQLAQGPDIEPGRHCRIAEQTRTVDHDAAERLDIECVAHRICRDGYFSDRGLISPHRDRGAARSAREYRCVGLSWNVQRRTVGK